MVYFLVSKCSGQALTGSYQFKNNHLTPDHYELVLRENYSFEYYIETDIYGKEVFEGTWNIIKDTLNLNIKNPVVNFDTIDRVVQTKELGSNWLNVKRVQVKMPDGSPFVGVNLQINKMDSGFETDANGMISVDIDTIKQIRINSSLLKKEKKFQNLDPVANHYIITLFDKNLIPILFSFPFQVWLVKKNKLIPFNRKKTRLLYDEEFIRFY